MSAEEASGKVDEDRNNEKKEGDKTDVKVYKLEHVKEHKTCKSLWLVIDNKVYDVTEFLDEHPGGEEVLLDLGGSDATEPFDNVSHSSDAKEMMKKYYIGELHDDDKTKWSKPSIQTEEEPFSQSTWTNWLVPLGLALAATLLYRCVMVSKDVS